MHELGDDLQDNVSHLRSYIFLFEDVGWFSHNVLYKT